jgi:hypothetical protein
LFVLLRNCGVKFSWQRAHAVWKVLLSGTERPIAARPDTNGPALERKSPSS